MSAFFSPQAEEDLREAILYIAGDSTVAARRVLAHVQRAIDLLASGGVDGREVTLLNGERVRLWLVGSYRLYYRRTPEGLEVVRLYHQARRPIER